jgi:hypothetical protein
MGSGIHIVDNRMTGLGSGIRPTRWFAFPGTLAILLLLSLLAILGLLLIS